MNDKYRPEGQDLEGFLLTLASTAIARAGGDALEDSLKTNLGAVTMILGRYLVRGVPPNQALAAIQEVNGDHAHGIAKQIIEGVGHILANARIRRDEGAEPVSLHIEPMESFSIKDDEFAETGAISHCMGAWTAGDYEECAKHALHTLNTYQKPILFHLLVLSLQRLGREEEVAEAGNRALGAFSYVPFHNLLMGVLLGKVDPKEFAKHIQDDGQRCQLRFYEGARYVTEGKTLDAKLALVECASTSTDLIEKPLAQIELQRLGT